MPKKIDVNEFCERVNKAYDGRISIVKETYIDTIHKVTAYCNVHKIYFECSRAKKLYEKVSNCPECSKQNQRNKHIKDWESVYKSFENKYGNKFSYDSSSYKGTKELMKVHCNDCGTDFEIAPEHHLKYNNGGCPNCAENKIVKCSKCGKEIEVNKHFKILSEMYCDECQKENNYKYCDICGRMLNDEDICDNEFCRKHNIQQFKTLIRYFEFDEQKLRTIYVEK